MPKYITATTISKTERVSPISMAFATSLSYSTESSVVVVREVGKSSAAFDHYGSEVALTVLEDPYWSKTSPVNNEAFDREQLVLKPNRESESSTAFLLTSSDTSYSGSCETSLVVSKCINHNPEDVWKSSEEVPTLEIPITKQNVFLGGLFSDTGSEIPGITIGIGDLDAKPNSPFILEMNPDNDESRIHFCSPSTGRWQNLQLFDRVPDSVLNRIKVLISTNQSQTNTVIDGFSRAERPESVLYDDKKAIASRVVVAEREKFFQPGHFFSEQYAIEHTFVPKPNDCPNIFYFVGPARGGTTAFGMLMAGVDGVDRSYFQPHKDLLRHGRPLVLHPEDGVVIMKETFGPKHPQELFDPVSMLLAAGVPREKLSVIVTLRNPIACFASLTKFVEGMSLKYYAEMQRHTLQLYQTLQNEGIRVTPFSYDLFGHPSGEQSVLENLMATAGFEAKGPISLAFNVDAIKTNMVWGEAEAKPYFAEIVIPTFGRGDFKYTNNSVKLPADARHFLEDQCMSDYQAFKDHSEQILRFF